MPRQFPNLRCLAIDATGVGTVLAEKVNRKGPYEVLDVIFSQPRKVSLVEGTVSNMEDQFLTILEDRKLEKEMQEYIRETTENDRVIFTKGESDDCLDSLMLCNEAIMWYIQNGPQRLKPFKMMSLGEKALKNKLYDEKRSRDRYLKKRRR